MAYKLIHSDEPLPHKNLVVVIFGEPGTGKTSLAFTASEALLMDFDEGLERSVGRKLAVKFDSWPDAIKFVDSGDLEKNNIKTLVTDTAGTMLDDYIAHYVIKDDAKNSRGSGDLSLQGYGAQKKVFEMFLSKLRKMKIDLVMVCHSKMVDDSGTMRHRPKMTGGSYDLLIAKSDLVGYMEMKNNKASLNFNPTDRHIGKNCAQIPNLEVPYYDTDKFQGFLAGIVQKTKDFMWRQDEAQVKAMEQVKSYKDSIEGVLTLEELEEMKKSIYGLSPIYVAQVMQTWNDQYVALWPRLMLTKTCKTPDDFDTLSMVLTDLPKYISEKLREAFKKHLDKQGVTYDTKAKEFVLVPKKKKEATEEKPAEETAENAGDTATDDVAANNVPGNKDKVTSKPGESLKGESQLSL